MEELPRGGPNNAKVDEEMRQCLNEIIDDKCLRIFAQINQQLRRRLPAKPFIHDRTVGKILVVLLFTAKRVRPLPVEKNQPDFIQKRFDYASKFGNDVVAKHCVLISQYSYKLCSAKSCRLSITSSLWPTWKNVTICLAISQLQV